MRPFDVGTGAVVGTAIAAHAAWIWTDQRVARDLGRFYDALPAMYAGWPPAVWARPGAWYNAAMAAWLHLVGRSVDAFQAVDVVWFGAVLVGVAWTARRLGGPPAGFAAAGLAAGAPMIRTLARGSWLHVPEAALVVGVAALLVRDPKLASRATVAAVGALGALAMALRSSAIPWLAPLAVVAAVGARRRAVPPLAAWALAAGPAAADLPQYLGAKLDARARYVADVPALGPQLWSDLGPGLVGAGVGVALFLLARRRGGFVPVEGALAAWIVTAGLLWGVFRAGLDNFTAAAAAIAILAGVGLGTRPVAAALIGLWTGLAPAMQAAPPLRGPIAWWLGVPPAPGARNADRPWLGTPDRYVPWLLTATCDRPCRIAVEDGLFEPTAEEPGRLGVFLLGFDQVTLVSIVEGGVRERVDAFVRWDVPPDEAARRSARWPQLADEAATLVAERRLRPAWVGADRAGRRRAWWTPGGLLRPVPVDIGDPSAAPTGAP